MSSGPVKHHWKAGGTCESSSLVVERVVRRTTCGLALGILTAGGSGTLGGSNRRDGSCSGSSRTSMMLWFGRDDEELDG